MSSPPVTHIVLFRYKADIPWTQLEAHFQDFSKLKTECLNANGKPYMLSMEMGKNHSWEPFSKGMTHAFILQFATAEDRDYYLLKDPVHHAFSAKAGPLTEDSVVMDIQNGTLFASSPSSNANTDPTKTYKGSCHCQSITFTCRITTPQHILCHCNTCQKLSGSPFSCNQIIPKSDITITSDAKPAIYTYTGASGNPVLCYHCAKCTSHIYHVQMVAPEKAIVRTLLLEGGSKMGVAGEIFGEGALGWVKDIKSALP